MYASENSGSVCGGWAGYQKINGIPPWVMPPLDYSGATMTPMGSGSVSLQQRHNGHAARKRWADSRTIVYCTDRAEAAAKGFGRQQAFKPPNPDVTWLDEHYPGKAQFK